MTRLIPTERGQLPLPGVSRRRKPFVASEPESAVQARIVGALRMIGLRVMVTSRVKHRCECGRWAPGQDGCSPGLQDLFVRREKTTRFGVAWPPLLWLPLEVKPHEGAFVRPEQQELVDAGSSVIVWTVEMAFEAVKQIDDWMAR